MAVVGRMMSKDVGLKKDEVVKIRRAPGAPGVFRARTKQDIIVRERFSKGKMFEREINGEKYQCTIRGGDKKKKPII